MKKKQRGGKREGAGRPDEGKAPYTVTLTVVVATRGGAISELMDCAIWMWFLEQTPLSIHVLVMAAYQCLEDLGKETGQGPTLKAKMGADKFATYYDYLRHSSGNKATGLDFPPAFNGPIIFDAALAFQ